MNSLDEQLRAILLSPFIDSGNMHSTHSESVSPIPSQIEQIKEAFKNTGYEKKHQILYGTKYPQAQESPVQAYTVGMSPENARKCTTRSHFVYDGQCSCGYTRTMGANNESV